MFCVEQAAFITQSAGGCECVCARNAEGRIGRVSFMLCDTALPRGGCNRSDRRSGGAGELPETRLSEPASNPAWNTLAYYSLTPPEVRPLTTNF